MTGKAGHLDKKHTIFGKFFHLHTLTLPWHFSKIDYFSQTISKPTLFFIYAGKVTKGMGVIRQIEGAKTNKFDRPLDVMTIESVSVHAYAPSTQ